MLNLNKTAAIVVISLFILITVNKANSVRQDDEYSRYLFKESTHSLSHLTSIPIDNDSVKWPFNLIDDKYFYQGFSRYLFAFFLLWLPVVGALICIGIGLFGWKYLIQGQFILVGLFWFVVTVGACLYAIVEPFIIIGNVWKIYSTYQMQALYLVNMLGGISCGALIYWMATIVKSRTSSFHRITKTKSDISFPNSYVLLNKEKMKTFLDEIESGPNPSWNNTEITPEFIAIAQSESYYLIFSKSSFFLCSKQDNQYYFDQIPQKSVKLKDLTWDFSFQEDRVDLAFFLNAGYLKKFIINYTCYIEKESFPMPYDRFISNLSIDYHIKEITTLKWMDLSWFEPDVRKGFFSMFSQENLERAMTFAFLLKLLPKSISKWGAPIELSEKIAVSRYTPKFIECIPMLVVYKIGLAICAVSNYQKNKIINEQNATEQISLIQRNSLVGYFTLKIWNQNYLLQLKKLIYLSKSWTELPLSTEFLYKVTDIWRNFAIDLNIESETFSKQITNKVYMPEQIKAVNDYLAYSGTLKA